MIVIYFVQTKNVKILQIKNKNIFNNSFYIK
jgi:hypothetical protein